MHMILQAARFVVPVVFDMYYKNLVIENVYYNTHSYMYIIITRYT